MCDLRFRSTAVASSACARSDGTADGRWSGFGGAELQAMQEGAAQSLRRTGQEEKLSRVQLNHSAHQNGCQTQRQRRLRLDELLAAGQGSRRRERARQVRRAPRDARRGAAQNWAWAAEQTEQHREERRRTSCRQQRGWPPSAVRVCLLGSACWPESCHSARRELARELALTTPRQFSTVRPRHLSRAAAAHQIWPIGPFELSSSVEKNTARRSARVSARPACCSALGKPEARAAPRTHS